MGRKLISDNHVLPHESLFLSTPNDVKIGTPVDARKLSVGPQFLSAVSLFWVSFMFVFERFALSLTTFFAILVMLLLMNIVFPNWI